MKIKRGNWDASKVMKRETICVWWSRHQSLRITPDVAWKVCRIWREPTQTNKIERKTTVVWFGDEVNEKIIQLIFCFPMATIWFHWCAPFPNGNFPMEFNVLLCACVNEWMLLNEPKRWDKSYLLGSSIAYVWISAAPLALLFSSCDENYDEREKYWRVFRKNIPCSHSIIAPQHMQGIHNHPRQSQDSSLYTYRLTLTLDRSPSAPLRFSLASPFDSTNEFSFVFSSAFFFISSFFFYLSILREFIFPPRIFNGCHAV